MAAKGFNSKTDHPPMGKLAALLAAFAATAFAASDEAAIQSTFVKPWVEALRSKDRAKLEDFYHPAVRACVNPATKPFFDFLLDRETLKTAAGPYHVSKLEPVKQPPPTYLPRSDVRYPVQPAYQLQVDFDQSNLTFVRFLAVSNGRWYDVFPCPNPKGMADFQAKLTQGAVLEKIAARQLAALKDPLRAELIGLLRERRKIDAVKKYQIEAHVNQAVAAYVINALQKSMP